MPVQVYCQFSVALMKIEHAKLQNCLMMIFTFEILQFLSLGSMEYNESFCSGFICHASDLVSSPLSI